jgi:hypothetical protein
MKPPIKILKKLETFQKRREKVFERYSKVKQQFDDIDSNITYLTELCNIKPNILFNQGRDKKYVYGKVSFYPTPQSTKKKSFRFIIGKVSEKKSMKKWNEICLEVFYDRIVGEYI